MKEIKYAVAAKDFHDQERIFNDITSMYPHVDYDEVRNIFEVSISPFSSNHVSEYYFAKNVYAKYKSFKYIETANKTIEKAKQSIYNTLTSDRFYHDPEFPRYYLYPNIQKLDGKELRDLIDRSRAIAIKTFENIFGRIYVKKIEVVGHDIKFKSSYGVTIYQKKRVNNDKCSSCGLLFDNIMPYLRTVGSSTCICMECARKLTEQMQAINLPEDYLGDYRKKLMFNKIDGVR